MLLDKCFFFYNHIFRNISVQGAKMNRNRGDSEKSNIYSLYRSYFDSKNKCSMAKMALILFFVIISLNIAYTNTDKTEANKSGGFPGNNIFENYGDENINILNGNLSIIHPNSPLFPGNGAFSFQLNRIYNSKIWILDENICDLPA